jgi:hypothetical protein
MTSFAIEREGGRRLAGTPQILSHVEPAAGRVEVATEGLLLRATNRRHFLLGLLEKKELANTFAGRLEGGSIRCDHLLFELAEGAEGLQPHGEFPYRKATSV